ncbi:acyl-CoA synthetase, partial [Vibrio sp. 1978]|nr:acyl-CoA synthetase [Vibrio sp. 1978]
DEFTRKSEFVDRQSFSITDSKVTVDEFMESNGQVTFQPVVNVTYEYRMREPGRY